MVWLVVLGLGCTRTPRDNDGDGWLSNTDCNDTDPTIAPGLPEIPYDGIDNDCDRNTPDRDADGDGIESPLDCDDTDPAIPTLEETPYDGIDNDCSPMTPDDDLDGDGYLVDVDCNDNAPSAFPGGIEVPYDGFDNDCDPSTPDGDLDEDGLDGLDDCDDSDPEVGRPTEWFEDCDRDGYAIATAVSIEACSIPLAPADCDEDGGWTDIAPELPLQPGTTVDCNDAFAAVSPGQELWFSTPIPGVNGVLAYDYDCDGERTPEYGLFSCYPDISGTNCVTDSGFEEPTSCGVEGSFVDDCIPAANFGQCMPDDGVLLARACR